ncbi:hypothetical protein EDC96DRAFT_517471 [Choanephora cucurbitarum]|nr:hypothetical protein EDC96DRAFT_517471 [Choanephora cucurbitarum]
MYYNSLCIILFLSIYVCHLTQAQDIKHDLDQETEDSKQNPSTTSSHSIPLTTDIELNTALSEDPESDNDDSTQTMNQDIYNSKSLFTTEPRVTNVTSLVQVNLYCEVDKDHCSKVHSSFVSAARHFSEVVNLKRKIVFQASYYSFCSNQCSNGTFGWGTPSSQFSLKSVDGADANFVYPQALARQLSAYAGSNNWVSYDVIVDINHDIHMNAVNETNSDNWNGTGIPTRGGFWFADDPNNAAIKEYQVDMEYVILHQMLHGLGMSSSWAAYFSDTTSPFQKLLSGLIEPEDNLKIMTPNPYWYVDHSTGPAYLTGFQQSSIFDKFLYLFIPAKNQTVWLVDYSFDMQGFCLKDDDAFIVNFMNSFINNATQSSKAKTVYVSMSMSKTLTFQFSPLASESVYYTNPYLNKTYQSIQLMTGTLSNDKQGYYRPGISTSHLDDMYANTTDFLMVHSFVKGKTLARLVEESYSQLPYPIEYYATTTQPVNITSYFNVTVGNMTYLNSSITSGERTVLTKYIYQSPIGPGILRILESMGYSTVLTNTNYSLHVVKTTKPPSTCDDANNNFKSRSTDSTSTTVSSLGLNQFDQLPCFYLFVFFITFCII